VRLLGRAPPAAAAPPAAVASCCGCCQLARLRDGLLRLLCSATCLGLGVPLLLLLVLVAPKGAAPQPPGRLCNARERAGCRMLLLVPYARLAPRSDCRAVTLEAGGEDARRFADAAAAAAAAAVSEVLPGASADWRLASGLLRRAEAARSEGLCVDCCWRLSLL
jgi:hypothetical protein